MTGQAENDNQDTGEVWKLALSGLRDAITERDRCLEEKNIVVLELMARIGELENELQRKARLIQRYKGFQRNMHLEPIQEEVEPQEDIGLVTVPKLYPELMDKIFGFCDYKTRIALSMTSIENHYRYQVWKDVKHLYVRRNDAIERERCTIIPHSFHALTNVNRLAPLRFYSFRNMFSFFSHVTTLVLESSQQPIVTKVNRLVFNQDAYFVDQFRNLEIIKFCTVKQNMGLHYTLSDLLALPKLKTIHIRENNLCFGNKKPIAPIEDVRIAVDYMEDDEFIRFCNGIQHTIRSFVLCIDLNFLPLVARRGPASKLTGDDYWQWLCSMPYLENASYPVPLMRMKDLISVSRYFPNMLSMRTLTLETIASQDLSGIALMLPDHFECIIVSESIRVGDSHVRLNLLQSNFSDVFTQEARETLFRDCRAVNRSIRLQLGIWRASAPATLDVDIGQVRLTAAFSKCTDLIPTSPRTDRRVFFWKDQIYNRSEFLQHFDIEYKE